MFTAIRRKIRPRRGLTLIEMLVVVALVVLMMVILIQVFQSALGAMSASRTNQELEVTLRSIDSMIRSDLAGVTAKMTPPNDPALKQGYFEYGENAPADLQGEDTDDFLAFTTRAADGQSFRGRQWLSQTVGRVQMINQAIQPITISSQTAEVIYFVRNAKLYRRVFLVAPDRSSSITSSGPGGLPLGTYQSSMFGKSLLVSWQGVNDISCRPGGVAAGVSRPPIPNDLGDLTNRENRAFRPRFLDDFTSFSNPGAPDGIADDSNADGVPDYYPTLYYDGSGFDFPAGWAPNQQVRENPNLPYPSFFPYKRVERSTANSYDVYAFPFIYPGMYSVPDPKRVGNGLGWVHYVTPNPVSGYINHSPLEVGDLPNFVPGGKQTWWGFPTWRETLAGLKPGSSPGWRDPITYVSVNGHKQATGLRPFPPTLSPPLNSPNFLPPVSSPGSNSAPFGYDGAGSTSFIASPTASNQIWEDDLVLTNVRSFDVKAYDPAAPLYNVQNQNGTFAQGPFAADYQDLGYGSASYLYGPNGPNPNRQTSVPFQAVGADPQGFGHEGRIPPLWNDFRPDPRRGYNVGDNSTGIIRLTRTFDTWSTAYTNAPTTDITLQGSPLSANPAPIYPAFPPPYPSPLRGIQIQIRITDPRHERTKVLTIRHDFTDKL